MPSPLEVSQETEILKYFLVLKDSDESVLKATGKPMQLVIKVLKDSEC